jgi:hypothetical protein
MQTVLQDLRYSLRQIVKSPGFTLTALVSMALGIGATTAVFSVIYAALLNPYPYPAADRIVRLAVQSKAGSGWANLNGPQIQQVRQLRVVESLLAMDYHALILTGHDLPENVNAIGLISSGFNDLGVPPLLGRGLLPSDVSPPTCALGSGETNASTPNRGFRAISSKPTHYKRAPL